MSLWVYGEACNQRDRDAEGSLNSYFIAFFGKYQSDYFFFCNDRLIRLFLACYLSFLAYLSTLRVSSALEILRHVVRPLRASALSPVPCLIVPDFLDLLLRKPSVLGDSPIGT